MLSLKEVIKDSKEFYLKLSNKDIKYKNIKSIDILDNDIILIKTTDNNIYQYSIKDVKRWDNYI